MNKARLSINTTSSSIITTSSSSSSKKSSETSTQITARTASEDSFDPKDLITQTDKDGKPIRRSVRVPPSLPSQQEIDEISPELPDRPLYIQLLMRRLLCCFRPHKIHTPTTARMIFTTNAVHPNRMSIGGATKLLPTLPPSPSGERHKKCLVLDLDETLVHSSFQYVHDADFNVPVHVDDVIHTVYVLKRPGVDLFLKRMSAFYEIVVYTASLNKYADPLLNILDTNKVISKRLFREDCYYHEGTYVKDLSLLNRDLSQCIIIDNSPYSYVFHPENAIDCTSYINDPNDRELYQIGDYLEYLHDVDDVRGKTRSWKSWCQRNQSS